MMMWRLGLRLPVLAVAFVSSLSLLTLAAPVVAVSARLLSVILSPPGMRFVAFDLSPDGRTIAAGELGESFRHPTSRVSLWTVATGRLARAVEQPPYANSIAYSPDGTRLALVEGTGTVTLLATYGTSGKVNPWGGSK